MTVMEDAVPELDALTKAQDRNAEVIKKGLPGLGAQAHARFDAEPAGLGIAAVDPSAIRAAVVDDQRRHGPGGPFQSG